MIITVFLYLSNQGYTVGSRTRHTCLWLRIATNNKEALQKWRNLTTIRNDYIDFAVKNNTNNKINLFWAELG